MSGRDAVEEVIAQRRLKFRFMKHDSWENALFVHWPVEAATIVPLLPDGLEPDLLDGYAWVGLVLLTERGVSGHAAVLRRIVSPIDHFGANVRTYVRRRGIPGIYFFSLECTSVVASLGARLAGIPYFPARMWRSVDIEQPLGVGGGKIGCFQQREAPCAVNRDENPQEEGAFVFEFSSVRVGRFREQATVTARWQIRDVSPGERETFMARGEWFTERYSVYSAWPARGCAPILLRGDVQHPPWTLQPASLLALDAQELLAAAGLHNVGGAGNEPHVSFSRGVGPVDFWMLEPV
jgi:uncharacterized protein YqjF (DUF2071 family)